MPSRNVMDNRVNAYQNTGKNDQNNGKGNGDWGDSFGQTLRGNGRPSDQTFEGPVLPVFLEDDAWWDVFEGPTPGRFGCILVAEAVEAPDTYIKTWVKVGPGQLVAGTWELVEPIP